MCHGDRWITDHPEFLNNNAYQHTLKSSHRLAVYAVTHNFYKKTAFSTNYTKKYIELVLNKPTTTSMRDKGMENYQS